MQADVFGARQISEGEPQAAPRKPNQATAIPSAPPASDSTVLSVSSWRTMRPRLAPSAARIPNSRWRAVERASSRPATFAHAISNTRITAPNGSGTVPLTSPTICCFSRNQNDADSRGSRRDSDDRDPDWIAFIFGFGSSNRHARPQAREHCDCVYRTLPIDDRHVRAEGCDDVHVGEEMEAGREHSPRP